jgi:hypothetical protein
MKEKGLFSVTVDANVWKKYKAAYDAIEKKMHAVSFIGDSRYEWSYCTDDDFVKKMQNDVNLMLAHADDSGTVIGEKIRMLKEQIDATRLKQLSEESKIVTQVEKPINKVTIDRLQMVLSGIGMNIDDKELDVIIDAVELIEDKAGDVTIDDIITLKNEHYENE